MTDDFKPYRAVDIQDFLADKLAGASHAEAIFLFTPYSRLPARSNPTQLLGFWVAELRKLMKRQKSVNLDQPIVWLTEREHCLLQGVLNRSNESIDYISKVAANIITAQSDRTFEYRRGVFGNVRNESGGVYDDLTQIDDPELLDHIKATLSKAMIGKDLLKFTEVNGINICLRRREKKIPTTTFVPQAYVDDDTIYLVDATRSNIGDHAVTLAHVLRQRSQEASFKDFFEVNNTPADILVRTRLLQADAFAVRLATAFILRLNDVAISSSPALDLFTNVCNSNGWRQPHAPQAWKGLCHAMSVSFLMGAGPGRLDIYEQACMSQIEAMDREIATLAAANGPSLNFPMLIWASPYSQENFIRRLTGIWDGSYITPQHIPAIQKELLSTGNSAFARPERLVRPLPFTLSQ